MEFQHGGDIYRNRTDYDFSSNINPLGMPEGCMAAVQRAISHIGEYPDYCGASLCRAIGEREGVNPRYVIPGNGAAELIYGLCYACRPRKALGMAPAFSEYENAVSAAGGKMQFWNLQECHGFALAEGCERDFLTAINGETDMVFLCNPNNPTGTVMDKATLIKIAERCERTDTYLCVDECFLPFLEEEELYTMKHELEAFPHLLVLRAFTKVYGMPGLRLGYILCADPVLGGRLRKCLPPWNTSVIAQAAGEAALKDEDFVMQTRLLIKAEKEYLIQELQNGLADRIYASRANFIFFHSREDLKERLLEKKILIRDCSNYRNLSRGYFRIAVRSHTENRELIQRWRSIREQ